MIASTANIPKLILPALFFGYALWTSGSFMLSAGQHARELSFDAGDVISGQLTAKLESLYKDTLPYRALSVDVLGVARYVLFGEGRKGVVVGDGGWLFTGEEFRTAADEERAINDASAFVAGVGEKLEASGIRLLVVPLPAKADLYREHIRGVALAEGMAERYADFRSALAAHGVDSVDTRPVLLDAKADGQLFLRGDTHWTPTGAAVVAQATSETAGPVSEPVPYVIEEGEERSIDGDLVKFIASPGYGAMLNLEPEQVRVLQASAPQPVDLGGMDLFGSAPVDVALVGTSYSANRDWSFQTLLQAQMGTDILNFAEEGHGPIQPMQAFLARLASGEAAPRLVIWEFPVRYLTDPDLLNLTAE